MSTKGIYCSEQLDILDLALDQHCSANGFTSGPDRETVARQLLELYEEGVTSPEALAFGLHPRLLTPTLVE